MSVRPAITILCLLAAPAWGQSSDTLLARGDSLSAALRPAEALAVFGRVLAADSGHYGALWRASGALIDLAKLVPGTTESERRVRDSLYAEASALAERAIRFDSTDAEGHFMRALALGRLARSKGGRDRVRFGAIIYQEAARAAALRPAHSGAHHVLGAWHAEVRRLSGTTRFVAKLLFGGGFLRVASWDSAIVHLEVAVRERPQYLFHHLELAEVYADRKRYAEARAHLAMIPGLPDLDVEDPRHRRRAAELSRKIENK